MNTYLLIIVASAVIICSFFFNIFAKKTNIPSVLMLIILGVLMKLGVEYLQIPIQSDMLNVLQILGNVGLVMIVLEAALDLKLSKDKMGLIIRSFLVALVALVGSSFGLAAIIYYLVPGGHADFYTALIYAVPLSIMSSAIIIPSVGGLEGKKKEFMVYESTFSDILGIMFFYFLIGAEKEATTAQIIGDVALNIVLTLIVAIITAYLLVYFFQRLTSQVKLFLIIAVLMLMYALGKYYHLSALLFILAFGLVLNNTKVFFKGFLKKYITEEKVKPILHDFHTITLESAFVIRTFFFVIFGMFISLSSLIDWKVGLISLAICAALFVVRWIVLKIFVGKNITPQLYIAPRGLITILLFFVIESTMNEQGEQLYKIYGFEPGILLFCILISSIIMTLALILYRGEKVSEVIFSQIPGIKKDKNHDGIHDDFEDRVVGNVEEQGLTPESDANQEFDETPES